MNVYDKLIEDVFRQGYKPGATEVIFTRQQLLDTAAKLKIKVPKNIGDVVYTYRFRNPLPESIRSKAPAGLHWIIRSGGTAIYKFVAARVASLEPKEGLVVTKIPDATPGIIASYALDDEQALLAKLRYNRLIDIFLRITCYSLQNHLRTNLKGVGQIEIDELYLGIDRKGAHYVVPVQAKGGKDKMGVVQIENDIKLCRSKFSSLICRSVGAQFMPSGVIALLEFDLQDDEVVIVNEAHYKLVPPKEISKRDLESMRRISESAD
jgi:hypothetical protein